MTGVATDDEKLELKRLGPATAAAPAVATAEIPAMSAKRSVSSQGEEKQPAEKSEDSDSDTAQEDELAFRLRDLKHDDDPERFQGFKREHWW